MEESRNTEAEELELLHDITRFLLRRGQQLASKYNAVALGPVEDLPWWRGAQAGETAADTPSAAVADKSDAAEAPKNCQNCGADLPADQVHRLVSGLSITFLCGQCYENQDVVRHEMVVQVLCGVCQQPLPDGDLRRRKRTIHRSIGGKVKTSIEHVTCCRACYVLKPEEEITVEGQSTLPPKPADDEDGTAEEATVEA